MCRSDMVAVKTNANFAFIRLGIQTHLENMRRNMSNFEERANTRKTKLQKECQVP